MVLCGELAPRILPLPSSAPAGDKPLASRSLRPRYIGLGEIVADFSTDVLPRGIRAWIPASAGKTIAGIGGFRSHDPRRVRSFSYQLLIPACAGTPRNDKPASWVGSANWHGGFCHSPTDPSGGQAPALHSPLPAPLDSGLRRNDEWEARKDDWGSRGMRAHARPRNIIFVPMTIWEKAVFRHYRGHVTSP